MTNPISAVKANEAAVKTSVVAAASAKFTFTLDSFQITDTRSRHEDTDYVSFTLLVKSSSGSGQPTTQKKSMGNLNNGTFKVGLSFPNVSVATTDTVVLNYLIVNSGHKGESQIYSTLENAGGSLATKGLIAGGAAVGSLIPIPGLGTLLGAGAGWLVGELKGMLSADCDGAVAAEQNTFSYKDLVARTAHGVFTQKTKHPGTDSATGCGGNSVYYVTWHIAKV
ncbi:MAG: hypothetical protein JWM43_3721 [Acidobacteriaceae bacterium]|nr:hypothetical protein [Acidobacteriaceae bacterium]